MKGLIERLKTMSVGADYIADWTASDPVLQKVQESNIAGVLNARIKALSHIMWRETNLVHTMDVF